MRKLRETMNHQNMFILILFIQLSAIAAKADTTSQVLTPKIYLDCIQCDFDYIRSEITFVNYVNDRKNAEIYILVTSQRTGSSGSEYTLTFIGKQQFSSKNDTLTFTTQGDESWDDIRRKMAQTLKLGLIQYIARSPIAEDITIIYHGLIQADPKRDKWKNWVFRTLLGGSFSEKKSSTNTSFTIQLSADKITEAWKIRSSLRFNYREDSYEVDDDKTLVGILKDSHVNCLLVRSLSTHLSMGLGGESRSSTFSNINSSSALYPVIEYNIFPYSQSTRREFRFVYGVIREYADYRKITIFDKTEERLFAQRFKVDFKLQQPWGRIEFSIESKNYFPDVTKNHLQFYNGLSLHLVKGFSVNIYWGGSIINDQLSLPREGALEEEILLGVRQLATDHDLWMGMELEYAFGSIYNNIVNPRFGN